ncbi:condensation domain-containing protein [Nocardia sp. 004]|uniref:condensation domain-containing protein n=1 Tax=Nocardia sp. 004 TaxID=3385978 RepID=UPI0039A3A86F
MNDSAVALSANTVLAANTVPSVKAVADGPGPGRKAIPGVRRTGQYIPTPPPRRTLPLARRRRPAYIPLAPAQERMWHAARSGKSSDWNVAKAVRLSGPELRPEALAAAIDDVVARHEPLRTRYPATALGPAQVVLPASEARVRPALVTVDEAELPHRIAELAASEFDLAVDLPLRAGLFVLGPQDIVLVLVVHHISLDGRSIAPLLRDLVMAYSARQAGAEPTWTPLPVDYVDYTLWKHAQLGDYSDEWSRATQQLCYWANTLAGRTAVLEFPYTRARPAGARSAAGEMAPVAFDPGVHRALLDRADAAQASLFMVLQAAFAVAVGAFSGSADVTVATTVAGRDHHLLDDLVGNFANDVLMRVRLDRAGDVDELLEQVRRVALAAFAHPDTPDQRLKRCLPEDTAGPLFQATLILQRGATGRPAEADPEAGLTITEIDTGVIRAKHDLEFGLLEHYDEAGAPVGIDGALIYPTDRFERHTAVAFVELFTSIVQLFAGGYHGPLTGLRL